jgi:hypothetical protein
MRQSYPKKKGNNNHESNPSENKSASNVSAMESAGRSDNKVKEMVMTENVKKEIQGMISRAMAIAMRNRQSLAVKS